MADEEELLRFGSELSTLVIVEGRNWKSASRRSAHLLVTEKLLVLLEPPLMALSFLVFRDGDKSGGAAMPIRRWCMNSSIFDPGD